MESYFGNIPSQEPPRKVIDAEPEQLGEKRAELHKIAQLPAITMGYKSVSVSDADYYPLDVLATILSRGQSSRLYKTLIYDKQIASQVSAGNDDRIDVGLFTFYAQMKPGKTTLEAEKEIYNILEDIKKSGVTDEELQKAKNIAQADYIRQFKTNQGRGFVLGYYEVIYGNYKKAFDVVRKYDAVTKDDILRVAKKYFTDRHRTVVTLIPEKQESSVPESNQ
jgi:predicted Zn-dependent peptidase